MPSIKELTDLLQKISRTTDRVRIEIDYNGREFYWKVPIVNLKAKEYSPRTDKKCPDDAV